MEDIKAFEGIPFVRFFLERGASLPQRQTEGSAGYDLALSEAATVPAGGHVMAHTGVHVEIPAGWVGLEAIRSSVGTKRHVGLSNGIGVIDADYRGEVMVALHNHGRGAQRFEAGERVAQLVIVPCLMGEGVRVDALGETARGDGGYGSTGRM